MRSLISLALTLMLATPSFAATPPAKVPAAKTTAAKAAPAKPAPAKPATPAKAAPIGPFDARSPADLVALLNSMGAKATISKTDDTSVFLQIETPSYAFNAQYVGCSAKGAACQGLAFSASSAQGRSTLAQLNSFNQTSITCRVYQDNVGKPHVMYSTMVFASVTREDMRIHIGAWQGCLSTFGLFLSDPIAYLADAP
jgi:hypothetical protein